MVRETERREGGKKRMEGEEEKGKEGRGCKEDRRREEGKKRMERREKDAEIKGMVEDGKMRRAGERKGRGWKKDRRREEGREE